MGESEFDMSAFEAQFAGKYSDLIPDEMFEEMCNIRDEIADLREMLVFRKEGREEIEKRLLHLTMLEQIIAARLKEIRALSGPGNDEKSRLVKANQKDMRKLDELERRMRKLQLEMADRARLANERYRIDQATENAKWRNRALPHQIIGAQRLTAARRGILGDKPGLGKTLQAIMTIQMLRELGLAKKILILTLKSVLKDFAREVETWYPGNFVWVLNQQGKGIKDDLLDMFSGFPEGIFITNYQVWNRSVAIRKAMKRMMFDTIIFDEAHVMADPGSLAFKVSRDIVYASNQCPECKEFVAENERDPGYIWGQQCPRCERRPKEVGEFCSVKNVFMMTGTWLLNSPGDLFPLLNLVDNVAYPDRTSFLEDYCVKVDIGTRKVWKFRRGGPERLTRQLGMKFTARDRNSAGVKMPPQEVKRHELELDEEAYPAYANFMTMLKEKAEIVFADGDNMTLDDTFSWYSRLRQGTIWPDGIRIYDRRRDPVTKEMIGTGELIWPSGPEDLIRESPIMDEAFEKIRDALAAGDRVVVQCSFLEPLHEMQRRLERAEISSCKLIGGLTDRKRQEMIDDFNLNHTAIGEHKFDVMLMQYTAGATGTNMSGANQVIMLDRVWNPGKEEQAADRVRRLDSVRDSIVHTFHCTGTATQLMDEIHEIKASMIEDFNTEVDFADIMRRWLKGES